jgi:hypothetical protein
MPRSRYHHGRLAHARQSLRRKRSGRTRGPAGAARSSQPRQRDVPIVQGCSRNEVGAFLGSALVEAGHYVDCKK